ncbi:MAG TPA: hypothetical protein VE993_20450 [Stellaceae bacterium]|jgi:hypothetical protein|nr:hypothetical protein [Stellaceae bacterium]
MQIDCRSAAEILLPDPDRRLSPRAAILVIGGMSLMLWSAIIGVAVQIF